MCKPDKGRGVVLLDKAIYLIKIPELNSDRTKFETISDAPDKYIRKMEDKLNNFLCKIETALIYLQMFLKDCLRLVLPQVYDMA